MKNIKKIIIILLVLILLIIAYNAGIKTEKREQIKNINNLEITEVEATESGALITIKIKNEYIKYYYEYTSNNIYNYVIENNIIILKDGSWINVELNEFQPVELGDWSYKVNNKEELKKIIASYYIYKYNVEESEAIQKVNKIIDNN